MGLIQAVQDVLDELGRTAEVHVFSSTEGGKFSSEDFDGYRSKQMQVHLNGKARAEKLHSRLLFDKFQPYC